MPGDPIILGLAPITSLGLTVLCVCPAPGGTDIIGDVLLLPLAADALPLPFPLFPLAAPVSCTGDAG